MDYWKSDLVSDFYYRYRVARRLQCHRMAEVAWRTVFLERLKGIYFCVPKAAGSTVIATIVRADADGAPFPEDHNTVAARRLISAERNLPAFWRAMHDPNCFRFTFVRNPYTRVISGFLQKVSRRVGRPKLNLPNAGNPSLRDFLEAIQQEDVKRMNRHWRPQSALIPSDLPMDFIGRFEQFDQDFEEVLNHLGVAAAPRQDRVYHATGADQHVSLIGPQEKELIDQIYAEDFRRFGYETRLPA